MRLLAALLGATACAALAQVALRWRRASPFLRCSRQTAICWYGARSSCRRARYSGVDFSQPAARKALLGK